MSESGVTPERVKSLLSSFLSGISKLSSQFSLEKTKQTSQSGGGGEQQDSRKFAILGKDKPDARDRKQFYSRVETFSPITWFAKPIDLSPLVCARYGWENTDTDMLQCVSCRAFLPGQLPKDVGTVNYRESYYKLKTNLVAAHEKLCTWSSNPSPESFMLVPYHHKEELLRSIQKCLQSLTKAQTSLPILTYTSFEKQGLPEERLKDMCESIKSRLEDVETNFDSNVGTSLDSNVGTSLDSNVGTSLDSNAYLFALSGWGYSSEQINVLQCNYCRRRIGLWNYKHAKETNGTERSHSGTENEQNDEENGEPSRKRIKIEKEYFDPIAEHRYWCPWLQTDTSHFRSKTSQLDSSLSTNPSSTPLKSPPSNTEAVLQSTHQQKNSDKETEIPKVPAWMIVLELLSNKDILHDWFQTRMKKSPKVEGVRYLRQVLRECTSPPSAKKIAELRECTSPPSANKTANP